MLRTYFIVLFALIHNGFICAQELNQAPNDCVNAIVVCGNNEIESNVSGPGTVELFDNGGDCFLFESNSLWFEINVTVPGTLAFIITPDSPDISVDYDFNLFGTSSSCTNLGDPIRCSTTNPIDAGLSNNLTGLRDGENDNSEGPGQDGNGFVSSVNVFAGERYLLVIDRPVGTGGFNLEFTGTANFFDPPVIDNFEPDNLEICLATTNTSVDLTSVLQQISSDPNTQISVHESSAEAFDDENPITPIENYIITQPITTLFVRAENGDGCFEIIDFDIVANEFIEEDTSITDIVCDLDGDLQEPFTLNDLQIALENLFNDPTNFNFSFHNTSDNAFNDVNPFTVDISVSDTRQIFGRVSCIENPDFFVVIPINLEVVPLNIPPLIPLLQCDVEQSNSTDGITAFNLNEAFIDFIEFDNLEFQLFETVIDRDTNQPITNTIGYRNQTPFNQTIFFRVVNNDVGCEAIGEITLSVQPTTVSLNPQSPFFACDDNPLDQALIGTFDLEEIRATNYPNLDVNFYSSLDELTLEQNPLSGLFSTEDTTLFVRIENSNQCQGVESFDLSINPNPNFSLQSEFFLCTDNPSLEIDGPPNLDGYMWIRENPDTIISQNQNVTITEVGSYRLEASMNFETGNDIQQCTTTANFEVLPSSAAIIQNIEINELTGNNNILIEVVGSGDYEYSINNVDFQDEPLFENIQPGVITVFVRDKNGCATVSQEISVIDYPRFFSPNGDEINDYWQLIGLRESSPTPLRVFIFDRFGKPLANFGPTDLGWDGNFNGRPLPSSDYWFLLLFDDGRRFNGHFTLKR